MHPVSSDEAGVETRREFLKKSGILPIAAVLADDHALPDEAHSQDSKRKEPWFRRTLRWGQTNLGEEDPARCDVEWWRQHWKRTQVQGLIINAGGIVAYYPSRIPLQHRAEQLKDRDLLGELVQAARKEDLVVLARMDSNRAYEPCYKAHPDWFAVDAQGRPYRAGELYVSCISSPYYEEFIPAILREIYEHVHPEGFTDNSWSGLDRESICYCKYCDSRFRAFSGDPLPLRKDWNSPVYRRWIQWNYARRLEVWDLFNQVTRSAGGPECLWIGMIGGDVVSQGRQFRDMKSICARAEIIMFDDQGRTDSVGFQSNGEMGKRIHGLLGWEKLIPESMAMYVRNPTFRKASNPAPEARMWMLEGIAGTIQPWWHHVGAYQEDRRQFQTAEPVYRWYAANESRLVKRRPVATVGIVWSQQNADFYGRDDAESLAILPYRGMIQALVRARIPHIPIHADHIDRDSGELALLVLPNLAAMSQPQLDAVRRFVVRGGGLLASGETGLCDEWGDRRADFGLSDLCGVNATGKHFGPARSAGTEHSYVRLSPDVDEKIYGPKAGEKSVAAGRRHEVLRGFDATNILPFGGRLVEVRTEPDAIVPLTLVPVFPTYPPETSWMRTPRTDIPALVLREHKAGGRIAYLPADIDRRFALSNLPDHGDLLENVFRWAARDVIPLRVEGRGLIDCHLYQQSGKLILHLVNLTSAGTWRSPTHELIPLGPLKVHVRLPKTMHPGRLSFLVSGESGTAAIRNDWIEFEIRSLTDHEVVVI